MKIPVPVGTVVWKDGPGDGRDLVADITGSEGVVVARGGAGGAGNVRFVSSVQQEPLLAERGEEGEEATFGLELKLLADVGLIGQPNAGKSTLLSHCSAAKPKVAPYPFTTTEPVLGVVESRNKSFVMMEVPGLIEGAHKGVGLGHEFLRHAERSRLLLCILDGLSDDPLGDWRRLNIELSSFDAYLGKKRQFIVVNKIDLPDVRDRVPGLKVELESESVPVFFVSAATGEGVDALLGKSVEALDGLPEEEMEVSREHLPTIRPMEAAPFSVTRDHGVYIVDAPRIERLMSLADLRDSRVMVQIWKEMDQLGLVKALEAQGVQLGDTVRLGHVELEWF